MISSFSLKTRADLNSSSGVLSACEVSVAISFEKNRHDIAERQPTSSTSSWLERSKIKIPAKCDIIGSHNRGLHVLVPAPDRAHASLTDFLLYGFTMTVQAENCSTLGSRRRYLRFDQRHVYIVGGSYIGGVRTACDQLLSDERCTFKWQIRRNDCGKSRVTYEYVKLKWP